MKKKWLKDKKGFTLVELIVVLVILAILIALLVPALTGYIDKARQKAKMAECRLAVEAAQTCLSEMYGASEGADISSLQASLNQSDMVKAIRDLAEVSGEISGNILITDNAAVKYLRYIAEDGTIVIYEKEHNPEYRIDEEGARYSEDAPGYLAWVTDLDSASYDISAFLDENGNIKEEYKEYFRDNINGSIKHLSKRLQVAYQEKYGGFPQVDWSQVNLQGLKDADKVGNAVWKPIVTKDNKQILVADKNGSTGNAMAAVVYYDGKYYYHKHSEQYPDRVSYTFIDDISFTIDQLLDSNGEWKALE